MFILSIHLTRQRRDLKNLLRVISVPFTTVEFEKENVNLLQLLILPSGVSTKNIISCYLNERVKR